MGGARLCARYTAHLLVPIGARVDSDLTAVELAVFLALGGFMGMLLFAIGSLVDLFF